MQKDKAEQYQACRFSNNSLDFSTSSSPSCQLSQNSKFAILRKQNSKIQKRSNFQSNLANQKSKKLIRKAKSGNTCKTTCINPEYETQLSERNVENQKIKKQKKGKVLKQKLNQIDLSANFSLIDKKCSRHLDQNVEWTLSNPMRQEINYYQQQQEKQQQHNHCRQELKPPTQIKKRGRPPKIVSIRQEENQTGNNNKFLKKTKNLFTMKLGEINKISSMNPFLRDCYNSVVESNNFYQRLEQIIQAVQYKKVKPCISHFLEFLNSQRNEKNNICLITTIEHFSLPSDDKYQQQVMLLKQILEVYSLPQFEQIKDEHSLADGLYKLKMSKACLDSTQTYQNVEDLETLLRNEALGKIIKLISYLKKGNLRQQIEFEISQKVYVSRNKIRKIYKINNPRKCLTQGITIPQKHTELHKEKNKDFLGFGQNYEQSMVFQELPWPQLSEYHLKNACLNEQNL